MTQRLRADLTPEQFVAAIADIIEAKRDGYADAICMQAPPVAALFEPVPEPAPEVRAEEPTIDTECARCENPYSLRAGEEATRYCDRCAHEAAEEAEGRLTSLAISAARLERIVAAQERVIGAMETFDIKALTLAHAELAKAKEAP